MESNATKYEIIKKSDVNFVIPVDSMSFGDGIVTATTSIGDVVFQNPIKDGNLENPEWVIREIGTHSQPDGTGTVEVLGSQVVEVQDGVTTPQPAAEVASNEPAPVVGNDVPMTQPNDSAPAEGSQTGVGQIAPESNI